MSQPRSDVVLAADAEVGADMILNVVQEAVLCGIAQPRQSPSRRPMHGVGGTQARFDAQTELGPPSFRRPPRWGSAIRSAVPTTGGQCGLRENLARLETTTQPRRAHGSNAPVNLSKL